MPKQRGWIILSFCIFLGAVLTWAQSRKAGLWEIASSTRVEQPGAAQGKPESSGSKDESSPPAGGLPVCMTQEMIDKYGIILPPSLRDCELSKVVKTADSFSADMTCKGSYNGIGRIESRWTDEDHVVGAVRFVARTKEGSGGRELRWTESATAVFKSTDCGNVKPRKMPAN
jgi:hypothetical protein